MKKKDVFTISEVRAFSRFYTNILGLLNQSILDSPYSLTEARTLLEIKGTNNCTAALLTQKLDIDRGYLSRILKRFESDGLIVRENSNDDRRIVFLHLTPKGNQVMSNLEGKAELQIQRLINHLTKGEKEKLVDSMKYIKKSLSSGDNSILIRSYKKEDIDFIVERHRELYDKEYGFSSEFVDYVEKYVKEFDKCHDEVKENIWIAEANGKRVGMIALVKAEDDTAQLRWFLIEPEMRGKGLGRKLMKTVIDFCKEKGYRHVFLWTVDILEAARHLYKVYGFALTEKVKNDTWTDDVINEERWDLSL